MGVYKLYAKKVMGVKDDLVYLYLYHLQSGSGKPDLQSLKIKLPRKYLVFNLNSKHSFNKVSSDLPKEYLLKLGFESVKKLNAFLREKLEEYIKVDGNKKFIEKENKTLNQWFNILISLMYNQGSILRYKNVLNLLEMFQNQRKNTTTIYFKEIDTNFIIEFRSWLLSEPLPDEKRKKNTLNSTIYKLKCLKAVLNKCHINKYYTFIENPFDHLKFKELKFPYDVLTIEELQRLINTELMEVYRRKVPTKEGINLWGKPIEGGIEERKKKNNRYKFKHSLEDIRNYFLFQLYSQGIRVSDLITLKWSHFSEANNEYLRIVKVMVKTKEVIRILVNYNMISLLTPFILKYSDLNKEIELRIININREIKSGKNKLRSSSKFFIKKNHLWWDFIPDEAKQILCNSDNLGVEKIENTQFEVYYIEKEMIDQLKKIELRYEENRDELSIEKIDKIINDFNLNLKDNISKERKDDIERNRLRLGRKLKVQFLSIIEREFDENYNLKNKEIFEKMNKLYLKRNELVNSLIIQLSKHKEYSNDFVFPLLNKKDFLDIQKDDYSRIDSNQYKKFQSVRTYYNGLLKIVAEQCLINKKLSSHTARHTYTSLMLELIENVSPYDIMNSLGHKNISTTQNYIRRFSDKNVDRLNLMVPGVLGYI